ncbi:hypothetical protein BJX65DRAFT_309893 [Aspergillus insuetus]
MGLSLTRWLERDSHLLESVCRTGKPQVGGSLRHYKSVQALLHRGVDLNVKHKRSGKTALHLAIETTDFKGHTNLVRDLAAGGANPNFPLHLAVAKTSPYAVGILLYKGVNAENSIRVTPAPAGRDAVGGGPLKPDHEVILDLLLMAPGIEVNRQAGAGGV